MSRLVQSNEIIQGKYSVSSQLRIIKVFCWFSCWRKESCVSYFHGNWVGSQAAILYQNKLIRESIQLKVEQFFK